MAEPPTIELKPNIDEPDIPVVVQPNVVEPDDEQSNVVVDTGKYFVNCEKMKVRAVMIDWCKRQALIAGFSIVIWKSDNGAYNRKKFIILGCERGGVYKERKKKSKKEDTAMRKTLCPFRLRGYYLASEQWSLSVVCGEHNHEMSKTLEGHLLVGRLKPEEKECVRELTKNLVAPKNIMTMLKGRNPGSKTNMKQIYNARQRFKTDVRGELSELQHLLKCCETHKYFHKCRIIGDSATIQDIFWAHPESIKLFNTFPTVLMMDSTYKTNKYKMPLFEIVGVTSTEESYNVGFAYIANEKEDNFVWGLETCKSLLISKETFPKVIVTNRDKSLIDECCCKDSTSEESYTTAVVDFRKVFENFPNFVKYVETTVLDPVKEKFVSGWTDSVMHIGNTTTNRVESQHVMPKSGVAPVENWFTFPDTGHILATAYNRVVVELTTHRIGHSETFLPIRGRPPLDSSSRIMCVGMVPNHCVYVKLKSGCPLPPSCKEWKTHRAPEAESWEDTFLDRMTKFDELMKNEKGDMELETNKDDPIIVD
ncbi:hypothetical protein TSUD_216270 [Trifolium subterraneum]|uniref:MULE transposase domain-containing protein n=1 Tax=Trifolium subterraneum TaxID=3900 RepID=A0A2Z6M3N0_TRISU|nr:hypothetical protein TSUD_216270 [Trifolium subterraneum]